MQGKCINLIFLLEFIFTQIGSMQAQKGNPRLIPGLVELFGICPWLPTILVHSEKADRSRISDTSERGH